MWATAATRSRAVRSGIDGDRRLTEISRNRFRSQPPEIGSIAERVFLWVFSLRIMNSSLEGRVLTVSDQFDVDVHDAEALAEIEMLANLIVATSEHEGRVPQDRIDEILGVKPLTDSAESGSEQAS